MRFPVPPGLAAVHSVHSGFIFHQPRPPAIVGLPCPVRFGEYNLYGRLEGAGVGVIDSRSTDGDGRRAATSGNNGVMGVQCGARHTPSLCAPQDRFNWFVSVDLYQTIRSDSHEIKQDHEIKQESTSVGLTAGLTTISKNP